VNLTCSQDVDGRSIVEACSSGKRDNIDTIHKYVASVRKSRIILIPWAKKYARLNDFSNFCRGWRWKAKGVQIRFENARFEQLISASAGNH